tara:strand:+ start:283 stop:546 length:264 start_codon:yes stop_codon:yes gene_type:complete
LANRGRPTQTKRQRERKRIELQKIKQARRAEVKAKKAEAGPRPTNFDPDLEGISAGPQERPAWQQEFFEEEKRAKEAAELEEQNKPQ